jgi:hypothetical protein
MTDYYELQERLENKNHDMLEVGMNKIIAVDDQDSVIFTSTLATCYGIGVVFRDTNDKVYRILTHHYSFYEDFQLRQLNYIKDLLMSIQGLKDLRVVCCSMDSLRDFNNLSEEEIEDLEKIYNTFSFYKEKNPDFKIEFQRSWYLIIDSLGKMLFATSNEINKYEEETKKLK